jgi:hypothetical protein
MTAPTVADAAWRALTDELVQKQLVPHSEYWHRVSDQPTGPTR